MLKVGVLRPLGFQVWLRVRMALMLSYDSSIRDVYVGA